MVRLIIIWRTLTITKNPLAGFLLKQSRTRKAIAFRNGCIYQLTWPQFRYFRDSYQLFSKYKLTQIEEDLKLETENGSIICSAQILPLICDINQEYTITQEKPDLYHLKNEKADLVGSSNMLVCI